MWGEGGGGEGNKGMQSYFWVVGFESTLNEILCISLIGILYTVYQYVKCKLMKLDWNNLSQKFMWNYKICIEIFVPNQIKNKWQSVPWIYYHHMHIWSQIFDRENLAWFDSYSKTLLTITTSL